MTPVKRKKKLREHSYAIVVFKGYVLMIKGGDGDWSFPGGAMEPSEASVSNYVRLQVDRRHDAEFRTVLRELGEETGLELQGQFRKSRQYRCQTGNTKRIVFFFMIDLGDLGDLDMKQVEDNANALRQVSEVDEVQFKRLDEVYATALRTVSGDTAGDWAMQPMLAEFMTTDPGGKPRNNLTLRQLVQSVVPPEDANRRDLWVPSRLRNPNQNVKNTSGSARW
jgi:8-oxo-dGTP pyrophosphatase MutT (NUDIX family)